MDRSIAQADFEGKGTWPNSLRVEICQKSGGHCQMMTVVAGTWPTFVEVVRPLQTMLSIVGSCYISTVS